MVKAEDAKKKLHYCIVTQPALSCDLNQTFPGPMDTPHRSQAGFGEMLENTSHMHVRINSPGQCQTNPRLCFVFINIDLLSFLSFVASFFSINHLSFSLYINTYNTNYDLAIK